MMMKKSFFFVVFVFFHSFFQILYILHRKVSFFLFEVNPSSYNCILFIYSAWTNWPALVRWHAVTFFSFCGTTSGLVRGVQLASGRRRVMCRPHNVSNTSLHDLRRHGLIFIELWCRGSVHSRSNRRNRVTPTAYARQQGRRWPSGRTDKRFLVRDVFLQRRSTGNRSFGRP